MQFFFFFFWETFSQMKGFFKIKTYFDMRKLFEMGEMKCEQYRFSFKI